jgi:internalin A
LISDISVLEGFTKLNDLGLHNNRISDLSVLEGLTRLIRLEFDINSLSDFSLLKGLRNLHRLKVEIEDPLPLSFLVDGERGGGVLKVHVRKFE